VLEAPAPELQMLEDRLGHDLLRQVVGRQPALAEAAQEFSLRCFQTFIAGLTKDSGRSCRAEPGLGGCLLGPYFGTLAGRTS
jgi:hypothetical protein